jgi:hypothetical protein
MTKVLLGTVAAAILLGSIVAANATTEYSCNIIKEFPALKLEPDAVVETRVVVFPNRHRMQIFHTFKNGATFERSAQYDKFTVWFRQGWIWTGVLKFDHSVSMKGELQAEEYGSDHANYFEEQKEVGKSKWAATWSCSSQ